MDLSNDELEDCVEKFRNTFLKHGSNKRNENDLLMLIENISEELDICKENEDKLRNKVISSLDSESSELTKKYVLLEEKFRKLEKENKEVKSQFEDLSTQMMNKLELQKIEFLQKIEKNLEISKSEITNLKNQIESDKICHESKEKELYNELQAVQAANDLQYDELESNLKRQLVDANSKLRHAQNIIRTLQLELNGLRSQQQRYNTQKNNVLHFQPTLTQNMKNNPGYYNVKNNPGYYGPSTNLDYSGQSTNLDYYEDENVEVNFLNETFFERQQVEGQQGSMVVETTNIKTTSERPLSRTTECSSVTEIIQDYSHNNLYHSGDELSKIPLGSSSTSPAFPKLMQNDKQNNTRYSESFSQITPSSKHNEKSYSGGQLGGKVKKRGGDNVPVIMRQNQIQKQMDTLMKYPPLPSNSVSGYEDFENYGGDSRSKLSKSYVPVLHRGSSSASRRKNNVPPLMPCSDANTRKKKQQKKRKLYNPDESIDLGDIHGKQ